MKIVIERHGERNPLLHRVLKVAERLFLLAGLAAVGFYGFAKIESYCTQAYAEWTFDRAMEGRPASWGLFMMDMTLLRLHGSSVSQLPAGGINAGQRNRKGAGAAMKPGSQAKPAPGRAGGRSSNHSAAPIGRLRIPAIKLAAMVLDGTDSWTLNGAIGHITGTAYPWEPGNTALAGHRDSFFRKLGSIKVGDTLIFSTLEGDFTYSVDEIEIVSPDSVRVLAPSAQPMLTLVTCFPFNYAGSAPQRFIVKARRLSGDEPLSPELSP